MATGVQAWSKTAASNATADSAVNWAEGMAPSAVNDSARAEMASVAKWRDDLNGSLTTAGNSTAYTLTSNQGLTATAGSVIAFAPHATNDATVTIAVDSIGAKPLRSAPGVELPAGVLILGTPYTATYYASNSGEWILSSFYGNPYSVPIGGGMFYTGTTAPNSAFVLPFGQAISRTTYATYFSLVGTTYGTGDGSTTFNVLDLRGRAVFGLDNMGGSAAGVLTSTYYGATPTTLGAKGGAQSHTLTANESAALTYTSAVTENPHAHNFTSGDMTINGSTGSPGLGSPSGGTAAFGHSTSTAGATTGLSVSTSSNAGGAAHSIMPPAIVLPFILRII